METESAEKTGKSPVKIDLVMEVEKEKSEKNEEKDDKDDDAHSLSGKSIEDDGLVLDPKEDHEEEETQDKKEEEIDPALKEQGQRVKKTGINRVLRRRPKHKPRWNVYPAVHVNKPEINSQKGFPTNNISTTKYTWWSFLPKNLFEQFRRATNLYFLFIVILTFIRQISPLTPVTSIIPLLFVLGVAALKEAYEDYGRFRADQKVNNRKFTLVKKDGTLETRESKNLKVGDVLYLQKNETIPSDTILISSALDDGVCYVETAQLDGESNLKLLRSIKETAKLTKEEVAKMDARIESEEPHSLLYTFNGRLVWDGKTYSLDTSQLLLRGAAIRNTPWICGVIAYTGKDTKLSLNQKEPPSKFSRVEKGMNRLVIYIFIFKFLCTVVLGVLTGFTQASDSIRGAWYLADFSSQEVWYGTIVNYFSYFILLSFLIPQSMMVTLEIVKVFQARLMEWDPAMEIIGDDGEKKSMAAKTSNLNDELALVNYVFSDKTGTLTQNKMVFGTCSINGTIYEESAEGKLPEFLKSQGWTPEKHDDREQSGAVAEFLRVLSICHSVVSEENPKTGELNYQAQSPDEAALCDAGRINGFVFKGRKTTEVVVDEVGHKRTYEILCQLEFTSARARMSTIVRTPEGKIVIYAKGADSIMFKRLNNSNPKLLETTKGHITVFSTRGLRTLALGKRELKEDEYKKWAAEYHEANTSLIDREKKVAVVCEKIEKDFELIGCTAIEDKLQDGVPDTIKYLLEAGMKVWVITGDKQETAINIGYSTNLLKTDQKKVIINVGDSKNPNNECQDQLQKALDQYYGKTKELGIIIDGASLVYALKEHAELFLKITSCCSSVVCCRVTPLQKAEIVRLIKTSDKKLVTLSIGDGANDVSMIQEAHIGIGIFGKEGTQAARASDYSLQQFSHLKRLICVHGRYSVIRNAACIYASLYKNLAFFFVSFWFAFFCGFTAQTIYDDWVVTFFNIVVTSLPPLLLGIMEKDILEDTIERNASTYKFVQAGNGFSFKAVFGWMFAAFYHSIIIFGGGFLLYWMNDIVRVDGGIGDIWNLGHILATSGVFIVLGKICIETKYWTGVGYTGIILSVLAYMIVLILISSWMWFWPQGYYVWYNNLLSATSYLTILGTIVAGLFPDLAWAFFLRNVRPKNWMILQESMIIKPYNFGDDVELPEISTSSKGEK